MKKSLNVLMGLCLFVSLSTTSMAQVKVYQSTDNTGLNKQERIEAVEGYLIDLSKSLKNMEAKLDENAKKLNNLDSVVKAMAQADKAAMEKLGEKKASTPASTALNAKDVNEVEKLKADFLVLKNEDIEKLKVQFDEINDTVKALQATIRDQVKLESSKGK